LKRKTKEYWRNMHTGEVRAMKVPKWISAIMPGTTQKVRKANPKGAELFKEGWRPIGRW